MSGPESTEPEFAASPSERPEPQQLAAACSEQSSRASGLVLVSHSSVSMKRVRSASRRKKSCSKKMNFSERSLVEKADRLRDAVLPAPPPAAASASIECVLAWLARRWSIPPAPSSET